MDVYNKQANIPLLAVVGPTACGKTALAVQLAQRFSGEIVSCDSMQIYRGMPIATAQPTLQEQQGIPHHLLAFLSPGEAFSVADYAARAAACIRDIHTRGRLPILAGGTGLYFRAVLDNMQFAEAGADPAIRQRLEQRAQQAGTAALLAELRSIDPNLAQTLHPNNRGRIIRALEIWEATGMQPSAYRAKALEVPSPYRAYAIGLTAKDRKVLYQRINDRVDTMLEAGLLDEAKAFFALDNAPTARQAIGYKELKPYLDGEISLADALERLKQQTRRYAKRQLTWFQRDERIHWLYLDQYAQGTQLLAAAVLQTQTFLQQGEEHDGAEN